MKRSKFFMWITLLIVAAAMNSIWAKPTVGAIRWDAWYGDGTGVNEAVENTLSVQRWQWRAPYFAKVVSENSIQIRGTREHLIEEINFAADAGLDYWAYCIYPEDNELSQALLWHLQAPNRARMNLCLNIQSGWLVMEGVEGLNPKFERYIDLMKRPEYQTVLDDRPLVYLLFPQNLIKHASVEGPEGARAVIDAFRKAVVGAGVKNPYIVLQDYSPVALGGHIVNLGADAIGAYAANTGRLNQTYAQYRHYVEKEWWPQFLEQDCDFVPLATTGFDMRPRIETGVPWDMHALELDINMYHEQPTPDEFVEHLKSGLDILEAQPEKTPAQAVLIYAWNEFDEGGWLCPTLGEGNARLEALKGLLKPNCE